MNNILDKICKDKLLEITEAKKKLSLDELKQNIKKKEFAYSKQIDMLSSLLDFGNANINNIFKMFGRLGYYFSTKHKYN